MASNSGGDRPGSRLWARIRDLAGAQAGGVVFVRLFLVLYSVTALRFLYYGFTYFRQLDDYIQYFNYQHFGGSRSELIRKLGLLAARPLAGLMDIYFWYRFYDNMIFAVLLLTALYAAAAALLFLIFRRHFGAGYVFASVFCLLPLSFEGTYWISASSRVVCGLFFAVAGAWFFHRFAESARWYHVFLFALLQLVSFGFYEQAIFLSFALTLVVALTNVSALKRRAFWGLHWFVNVGIYLAFTSRFVEDSRLYGQRYDIIIPNTPYYFRVFLPEVLGQLKSAFLGGGLFITLRGFFRGWATMVRDGAWFYAACVAGAATFFWMTARREEEKPSPNRESLGAPVRQVIRRSISGFFMGAFLAAAPVVPFFVLGNPWFSLRNTVMSFPGIALMVDSLATLVLGPIKRRGVDLKPVAAAALVAVFLVASVAELSDYRATTENDERIVRSLSRAIKDVPADYQVVVLNVNPSYLPEQSYFYHEHIHGVTESDWALTGALRAMSASETPYVTPIATTRPVYRPYDKFDEYDACFLFDGKDGFVPLTVKHVGGGAFHFFDAEGELRARITRDDAGRAILTVEGG